MESPISDQKRTVQEAARLFLLCKLTEAEHSEFELVRISGNLDEEFGIAEEILIEDYLDNSLSQEDLEQFKKHCLFADEQRKNIRFMKLLREHTSKK